MKRLARVAFTVVRIAVGVGLLAYLSTSGAIHWPSLLGLAKAWPITAAALAVLFVDMVITALRLCVLLAPRGLHLPLWASTRLTLIGIFFNACLPGSTGGDVVRIYYASEGNPGRRTEVATIILFDRAVGLFALMLWPLAAAVFFPGLVTRLPALQAILVGAALVAAAMLAGYLLCCWSVFRSSRLLEWIFRKLPLGGYARLIYETLSSYRSHSAAVLAGVGISLLTHTMSTAVALLIAAAINPSGMAWEMALLVPIGQVANMVPLTPGGLGVGEAAFDKLFSMAGLNGGAEVLLGWRMLTLLISLMGMAFYFQGRKRFVHAVEQSLAPQEQNSPNA